MASVIPATSCTDSFVSFFVQFHVHNDSVIDNDRIIYGVFDRVTDGVIDSVIDSVIVNDVNVSGMTMTVTILMTVSVIDMTVTLTISVKQ